jgi:hypothetical protein
MGDNPFGVADLDATNENDEKYIRLEGIPPDCYDGDRNKTHQFLTQFKRFMLMNRRAAVAKDLIAQSVYFLLLLGGSKVDNWTERQYEWLDQIEADPWLLPHGMNAWHALEQEFKHTFIDYAAHEKAHDTLRSLKMKEGNVDQYIADFEFLSHHARVDVNDPTVLWLFSTGLPLRLAEACVDLEKPGDFEQWKKAVQSQQRNWIIKQGLRAAHPNASQPQSQSRGGNYGPRGQFFWRRGNNSNQQGARPPRPQLPLRDPNAMDTSATARKATTKAEKQKHRQEGWCYKCLKQGHLARDCPTKKTRARAVETNTANVATTETKTTPSTTSISDIATRVLKYTDDERDELVRIMREAGEDSGFQTVW